MTYKEIIKSLNLAPLDPEGGWFSRIWYKPGDISVIYYLLTKGDFSEFHKLPYPEQYLFLMGDTVELFYGKTGTPRLKKTILGQNLKEGEKLAFLVEADMIQGSCLKKGGEWALLSTIMNPSYENKYYKPLSERELLRDFPDQKSLIESLTRR